MPLRNETSNVGTREISEVHVLNENNEDILYLYTVDTSTDRIIEFYDLTNTASNENQSRRSNISSDSASEAIGRLSTTSLRQNGVQQAGSSSSSAVNHHSPEFRFTVNDSNPPTFFPPTTSPSDLSTLGRSSNAANNPSTLGRSTTSASNPPNFYPILTRSTVSASNLSRFISSFGNGHSTTSASNPSTLDHSTTSASNLSTLDHSKTSASNPSTLDHSTTPACNPTVSEFSKSSDGTGSSTESGNLKTKETRTAAKKRKHTSDTPRCIVCHKNYKILHEEKSGLYSSRCGHLYCMHCVNTLKENKSKKCVECKKAANTFLKMFF